MLLAALCLMAPVGALAGMPEKSSVVYAAETAAASVTPTPAAKQVTSLSRKKVYMYVGSKQQLKVENTKKKVKWSSSKKSVVTVKNGKLTAVGAGTAKITAKVGTKSYKCTVYVVDALSRDDFALYLTSDGKTYTNGVDYLKDSEYSYDYLYSDDGDETVRGIKVGDSLEQVQKKYGENKINYYSNWSSHSMDIILYDLDAMSDADSYIQYTYSEDGRDYSIRFFLLQEKVYGIYMCFGMD
jgi:hypothetical protein